MELGSTLRLVNDAHRLRAPAMRRRGATAQPRPAQGRLPSMSENRAASRLDAHDARWIMAIRAAQSIEGGAAAIISPQRRHRLLAAGAGLGLRPFDTSLVIAIVQDAARSGLPALGSTTEERLTLVRQPPPEPAERGNVASPGRLLLAAALAAAAIFAALIAWIGPA